MMVSYGTFGGMGLNKNNLLRQLPSVDKVLKNEKIMILIEKYGREVVTDAVRKSIDIERKRIINMNEVELSNYKMDIAEIMEEINRQIENSSKLNLKKVINGTGVILHTNLGRALLAKAAIDAINVVGACFSNLEIDLETGERGSRYSHVEELLCELTGAESAMVVNNNAAAVLLVLSALAQGKEVIISRGQLVEIGGSFRVPDVMKQSGAILVEVGTTNRTHLWDYENAITQNTAILLKVHTSNYKILGFTQEVTKEELVELAKKYGLISMEDLGSGILVDLRRFGLEYEPTVQESIEAGFDVVTFSGDKLLGGPQAGIILGKKHIVDRIKKHPLNRAVRIDKLTLAALEATLRLYKNGNALKEIPIFKMMLAPLEELKKNALKLYKRIKNIEKAKIMIVDELSQIGGGSLPQTFIPTKAISIEPKDMPVDFLAQKLRNYEVPILARINKNRLIIDMRTLMDEDLKIIIKALLEIMGG